MSKELPPKISKLQIRILPIADDEWIEVELDRHGLLLTSHWINTDQDGSEMLASHDTSETMLGNDHLKILYEMLKKHYHDDKDVKEKATFPYMTLAQAKARLTEVTKE